MSENYTTKELMEAIYEVRDRVTRIEEKLNRAERLEDKVDAVIDTADDAIRKSDEAFALAQANKEEIKSMKANAKWAWGFAITLAIALIAEYFGIKIQ
jgi:DNA repair exonuclease SbcCD ATPase subunit